MIFFNSKFNDIHLQTESSSYVVRILKEGHISSLYFGPRLENRDDFSSLYKRRESAYGVTYFKDSQYSMHTDRYEFSHYDKGDYREASIDLQYADGSITCEFFYKTHRITGNQLEIDLQDPKTSLEVTLFYQIDGDRILRWTSLNNKGKDVRINHICAATIDLDAPDLRYCEREVGQGISEYASAGLLTLENDEISYSFGGMTEEKSELTKIEKNAMDLVRVNSLYLSDFTLKAGDQITTDKVSFSSHSKLTNYQARSLSGTGSISFDDECFTLSTKSLCYIFDKNMKHLYFGASQQMPETLTAAGAELDFNELIGFEGAEHNFSFVDYKIQQGKTALETLPSSHQCDHSLTLLFRDENLNVDLEVIYGVFVNSDCITRSLRLTNHSDTTPVIVKALSLTLPVTPHLDEMMSLDGGWAGERHINRRVLPVGKSIIDSKKGSSGNHHSPFMGLMSRNTGEFTGQAMGLSLIYSGNHQFSATLDDGLKTSCGINPHFFAFHLETVFETPEAVLTFSPSGLNQMSRNFHHFINNHVVPKAFQNKERPVLINNWEATYFHFNERKLLSMAKSAKKLGVELFVLDDGWFGKRDGDNSSLGDYTIYRKKLKSGLSGLCKKINNLGLDFGLWVEPEMISIDSDLYRKHPEFMLKHPDRDVSLGRNQCILDFANPRVVDHVYKELEKVFSSCNISYVKWDMNRNFSDTFSPALKDQRETTHRYMLGLYDLMKRIITRFPDILFEGCASGGDRFDMGILSYFPQIWTSDCSDATERTYIKYGTSMVYPQSVMGSHVSSDVNHQMMRKNPLESRFNVASCGVLGYELDLNDVTAFDKKIIADQIAFYKKHRALLQFGSLTRLESPFEGNHFSWMVSDKECNNNIMIHFQELVKPLYGFEHFKVRGLPDGQNYRVTVKEQTINVRAFGSLINHELPFRIKQNGVLHNLIAHFHPYKSEKEDIYLSSTELNHMGFIPKHQFIGSDMNENVRFTEDFSSRLYMIDKQ